MSPVKPNSERKSTFRINAYMFLSTALSENPGSELTGSFRELLTRNSEELAMINNNEFLDGKNLIASFLEKADEETWEKARWDFSKLFIGPYSLLAPPYESIYLSGKRLVMQEPTVQVRKKYAEFDIMVNRNDNTPDDRIDIEFEFMSLLIAREREMPISSNEEQSKIFLHAQKDFLKEHLLKWAPLFCADIKKNAETDLYRGFARLLNGFLETESVYLKIFNEENENV